MFYPLNALSFLLSFCDSDAMSVKCSCCHYISTSPWSSVLFLSVKKYFYPCVSDWIISIILYFRPQIIFSLLSILLLSISTEFFILVFVFFQSKIFLVTAPTPMWPPLIPYREEPCCCWVLRKVLTLSRDLPDRNQHALCFQEAPCVLHSHLRDRPLTI